MTTYAEEIAAARRLTILLALNFAPGYTLGRPVLRAFVERTGYITSADLLAAEIAWLAEMGYVEPLGLDAVRLTVRGEDVAIGRIQVPGVRSPSPGEVRP
ncbi:MAG: hypothetical protein AUJ80_01100 [Gallionellaceae bacterium CG1_02_60_325]|nr:MAG: hypothetical protein AUJ80_01100 [Gallionellaceae bacterium CG1_02_60_325]